MEDPRFFLQRKRKTLQISARVLSRVNNKDTILTGWERAGLWPYNPDIAYKSSAVVETIEQRPSKANNHKRKRGMRIDGGKNL